VFFAPVSSGSTHDPLPPGDWKVTGVGWSASQAIEARPCRCVSPQIGYCLAVRHGWLDHIRAVLSR
jgi:hypothetical protein